MLLQAILFIILVAAALMVLRRQYHGTLVATPYAHMLYFLFATYIGGFLLAPYYDLQYTGAIAFVGFSTVLAALAGYFLTTTDIRAERSVIYRFAGPHMKSFIEDPTLLITVAVLIALSLPLAYYFFDGLPPTVESAFSYLKGSASLSSMIEVSNTRFELTKSAYFGGEYRGQGLIRQVLQVITMAVTCYFFMRFAIRRSLANFFWVVCAIVYAWIIVGGVGDRAPYLEVLIVAVSAYSLCAPVRPRTVLILFSVFVLLVLATSLYSAKSIVLIRMGLSNGLADLFWRNLERIFVGNSINDARVVELVESGRWALRHGAVHFRNFVTAIPGVEYGKPVAYELFAYFNPYSDATTFFSGTYLTAAFLDFGKAGAAMLFFLCGALVGFTERLIFVRAKISGVLMLFVPLFSFTMAKVIIFGPYGVITSLTVMAVIFGLAFGIDESFRTLTNRTKSVLLTS